MQTRFETTHVRYSFDSLGELGEYIARTPRTWRAKDSEGPSGGEDWDLRATYAQTLNMARNGWIDGAMRAQEALKAFTPETPAPDTKVDFYGFRPHVPRYCAGAPDSMIRRPDVATGGAGRVLTLAVPVNALGSVNAMSMANFGVAVAQYVNQLEMEGTRVEVIGMIASTVSGVRTVHSWTVKRADQPLDLAVMAFSIGHPAMFRRLGFALRERCCVKEQWGYGNTVPAAVSDLINPAPGTVILNGMAHADTYAPTAAKGLEYVSKMIDAALAKQQEL